MTYSMENIETAVNDYFSVAGKFAEHSKIFQKNFTPVTSEEDPSASVLTDFSQAFREFGEELLKNPAQVPLMQMEYLKTTRDISKRERCMLGKEPAPVMVPEKRRSPL